MIEYPMAGPRFTEADARAINLHPVKVTEREGTVSEGVALHLTGKPYLMIMPRGWSYTGDASMELITHAVFLSDIATVQYQPLRFTITWQTTTDHAAVVSAEQLAELLGVAPEVIDPANPLASAESTIEDTLADIEDEDTFDGTLVRAFVRGVPVTAEPGS